MKHKGTPDTPKDGIPRECTLQEVADELGICVQRAYQLEQSALRKLRAALGEVKT